MAIIPLFDGLFYFCPIAQLTLDGGWGDKYQSNR
jgi:hypothetical protein